MKRCLLLLTCLFVLGVQSASCAAPSYEDENTSSMDSSPGQEDTRLLQSIEGSIVEISSNAVAVKDKDGVVYTFKTDEKTTVDGTLKIGASATLCFYGKLSYLNSLYASKIQVKAAESTPLHPQQAQASALLQKMTLQEKVGQLFLACCPEEKAAETAKTYQPGGYLLFAKDFKNKTKGEVKSDIASYQENSKINMLIAVDEEGGTVNRVSLYTEFRESPFQSPQALYEEGGFARIREDTEEKCKLLQSLGINCNLAPVCDVSVDSTDFIYERSFGLAADATSQYVKEVVSVMQENQMGCVLKHFPGYGDNEDTHIGLVYDQHPYTTFANSYFKPFQAGIAVGAGAVLVSHNVVESMDTQFPASLSQKVHAILREELDFQGVIVTDELSMGAIRQYTDGAGAAVLAIEAGNDMLCTSELEKEYQAVLEAVENGRITEERIDESVCRILSWKLQLGIIE